MMDEFVGIGVDLSVSLVVVVVVVVVIFGAFFFIIEWWGANMVVDYC